MDYEGFNNGDSLNIYVHIILYKTNEIGLEKDTRISIRILLWKNRVNEIRTIFHFVETEPLIKKKKERGRE